MEAIDIIVLNFEETRRRSIQLWTGIPYTHFYWKPDKNAFSVLEMIRHVLEGEHLFHKIIENRGNLGNYISPWADIPYSDVAFEIIFAKKYRDSFLNMLKKLHKDDLQNIIIERKEVNQSKLLGDYLNRMVYHEAVHTGQLLSYLRSIPVGRPQIWD